MSEMREIKVAGMSIQDNPAYMKVGDTTRLVTFPGSNNDDPGWAHAMILTHVEQGKFLMEEVRCLDLNPNNGLPFDGTSLHESK